MIKISLDESYVFDLLSIYEVKLNYTLDLQKKTKLQQSYDILINEIVDQIGLTQLQDIKLSNEYAELRQCNELVFKLVDRADESELSKLTAEANYQRYIKKSELQTKFFNNDIQEVKL